MMKAIFLVAALIALASAKPRHGCNKGPSYWCQSEVTAKECGVINFCKATSMTENTKLRFQPSAKKSVLDAPPVNVSFYYESLCPGCREVWSTQLYPTYQKLAKTGIVNFEIVPFGNAQEQPYGSSWYFTCQHGPNECIGNIIESCALHLYPDPAQHIPFLHCLEQYGPYTYGSYCAQLVKIDYTPINTCANSDQGKQLEHQMALKTLSLNPPHQYVPWLNLNGQHTTAIQNGLSGNMLATVCNAYTGTKPVECTQTEPKVCLKQK